MKDIKSTIIDHDSYMDCFFEFVEANEKLAFDIETSGVNSRKDAVMGIGISNGQEGYYLPLQVYDINKNCLSEHAMAQFLPQFLKALEGKKLLAWNGGFEAKFMLERFGWNFIEHFYSDGMLKLHLLDENRYNYGLKEYGSELYGSFATDKQDAMLASSKANGGSGKEYYKASTESLGIYCIYDCILTYWIDEQLDRKLQVEWLWDFFYKQETMPLLKYVTIPMEMRGIKLDIDSIRNAQAGINADLETLEAQIQRAISPNLSIFINWYLNKDYPASRTGAFAQAYAEMHNLPLPKTKAGKLSLSEKAIAALPDSHARSVLMKEAYMDDGEIRRVQALLWATEGKEYMFNLNSKHHLKKLFFDTLKEQPLSRTEKGSPQVDEDFLIAMAEKYEWCAKLRVYNKLIKIRGTYIDRFLEEQEEGRFYPSFYMHRTVSGRYSGDLQQLSRPLEAGQDHELVVKYTNMIRTFFIADENSVLIGADYESLEPHVFAHVSGDEKLKDIFRSGNDFYSTIAINTEQLEGVSADKQAANYLGRVDKSARQKAKAYALGVVYGLTGYKLQFEIGCSVEEGDALVADYLAAFPELAAWMKSTTEFVCRYGYIKTEAGRIRHLARAKEYVDKYGLGILNSLELWKKYHEAPVVYEKMKRMRKELKNYLNNANNFQIQGLSASIVSRSAIAFNQEAKKQGLNALIVMSVHDELVVHAPKSESEIVAKLLQRSMEDTMKISLDLHAEPNIATCYADTK